MKAVWGLFIEHRRLQNLTQSQAGQVLGVSQTTISDWELLNKLPEWHELPKIAAFLRITPEELAAYIAKNFLPALPQDVINTAKCGKISA